MFHVMINRQPEMTIYLPFLVMKVLYVYLSLIDFKEEYQRLLSSDNRSIINNKRSFRRCVCFYHSFYNPMSRLLGEQQDSLN